jgi:hypothetical protein
MEFSHPNPCLIGVGPDQVRPRKKAKRPVRPPAMFIFGDGQLDIGNSNMLASGDYDVPHDEQQTLDSQWAGTDGDNMAQFIGICHIYTVYICQYLNYRSLGDQN